MKTNAIIIFGFSGSGKSTVAELLGNKLGLRVVHPSSAKLPPAAALEPL